MRYLFYGILSFAIVLGTAGAQEIDPYTQQAEQQNYQRDQDQMMQRQQFERDEQMRQMQDQQRQEQIDREAQFNQMQQQRYDQQFQQQQQMNQINRSSPNPFAPR